MMGEGWEGESSVKMHIAQNILDPILNVWGGNETFSRLRCPAYNLQTNWDPNRAVIKRSWSSVILSQTGALSSYHSTQG